jgi:hypothetical protein
MFGRAGAMREKKIHLFTTRSHFSRSLCPIEILKLIWCRVWPTYRVFYYYFTNLIGGDLEISLFGVDFSQWWRHLQFHRYPVDRKKYSLFSVLSPRPISGSLRMAGEHVYFKPPPARWSQIINEKVNCINFWSISGFAVEPKLKSAFRERARTTRAQFNYNINTCTIAIKKCIWQNSPNGKINLF